MSRIIRVGKSNFEPLLLFVLGILTLTWFRGRLIDQGDFGLPLNRLDFFHASLAQWDSRWSFGVLAATQAADIPYAALGAISQLSGIPLLYFEEMMFYVWFTAGGLFMYYLCRTFGFRKPVAALTGAVYMMNPFSLIIIWQVGQGLLQIVYATAPLSLAAFNEFTQTGRLRKLFAVTLAWIAIGGPSAFVNPSYLAIFLVPIIVLFTSRVGGSILRTNATAAKLIVLRSGKCALTFLAANVFWFVPVFSSVGEQFGSLASSQTAFGSLLYNYDLNSAALVDSVRLLGYWALGGGAIYGPYFQWGANYFQLPLLALTFSLPILVGFALVKNVSRAKLYFGVVALVGLFLIGGTRSPFGPINLFLFDHLPSFRVFQEAFQRFGVVLALGMSPLIASGIHDVYTTLHGRIAIGRVHLVRTVTSTLSCLALIGIVLGAVVFPFWTGDVVQSPSAGPLSPRIVIPSDFGALRDFTATSAGNSRIISLPLSNSYNAIYNWQGGGYVGSDPTIWFSSVPTIMVNNNKFTEILQQAQSDSFGPAVFGRLLAMAGVKYVVFHADSNFTLLSQSRQGGQVYSDFVNRALSGFDLAKRFGSIDVYHNSYSPYPQIYVPQRFFLVNGTDQSVLSIIQAFPEQDLLGSGSCEPNNNLCANDLAWSSGSVQSTLKENASFIYVPRDGSYSLFSPSYMPISDMGQATLWKADNTARDSFTFSRNSTTPPGQIVKWTIDRSVGAMRGMVFPTAAVSLGNLSQFYVWVDGDGSGNQLIIQLYDSGKNYIAFTQTIDWTGWKPLIVPLPHPSYTGGEGYFNYSNIISATYYYDNTNIMATNSTVVIGPPELQQWGQVCNCQTTYTPVSDMGQATLWRADNMARDSFTFSRNSITPPGQIVSWTVDRTVRSMRGIVFPTNASSLGGLSQFYVWVDGDGSGNQLIIQLYDSGKNYIAFTQTIDWTGWKRLFLPLYQPNYVGLPMNFDYLHIISATYYYDNTNIMATNSTVVIGPPDALGAGPSMGPFRLNRGSHPLNNPTDTVVLLDQSLELRNYPSLAYRQTGTNQFSINVYNSTRPFPLIFGESFNKNWKACVSDSAPIDLVACLPESDHFVANDYANGWIIKKTGSFALTIFFLPDVVERFAIGASVIAWIIMAVVVLAPIGVRRRLSRIRLPTQG